MRPILKILLLAGGVCLLFIGGCFAMIYNISHRLDCEYFNIDNLELRTYVDIPELRADGDCDYNEQTKVKGSRFYIGRKIDFPEYIMRNRFQRAENETEVVFSFHPGFNSEIGQLSHPSLYIVLDSATGEESGKKDRWLYVLDSVSASLWVEVLRTEVKP